MAKKFQMKSEVVQRTTSSTLGVYKNCRGTFSGQLTHDGSCLKKTAFHRKKSTSPSLFLAKLSKLTL